MKKNWAIFLPFFVLGYFLFVQAYSISQEKIEDFSVEIWINKDGSFLVKESITYNFGSNFKHGIYRKIPLGRLKLKVEKVIDEFGAPYKTKISEEGEYLRIRIGDPLKLVSGKKTYNIFYLVQNGLGFFKDHDEIYWNVTGNEWQVPIERAKAILHLPEKVSKEKLKFACYTGHFGSKEKDCSFEVKENGEIVFLANRSFLPGEGLTIALGWPKGIVKEPNFLSKILWQLEYSWPLFIPFFVFVYLFRKWFKEGRDPKIKKPIVVQYTPPDNLKPAEMSFILNQRIKPRDLSATLVDLAIRGFIKIKEIKKGWIWKEKDYEIEKLKDFHDLSDYERTLLERIFKKKNKIRISMLQRSLHRDFSEIAEKISQKMVREKYFVKDPLETKIDWAIKGVLIIILSIFFVGMTTSITLENSYLFLSLILSGILFIIFSPFMPKRTKKGTETLWYILGFKKYIETAEKYRAQFYERAKIFEEYLPYAISFDLVDKWAKAFEGIYKTPPQWYEGAYVGSFSSKAFSSSLNSAVSSMGGMFTSRGGSGLGGGGSAGGGGGGGGGGSW